MQDDKNGDDTHARRPVRPRQSRSTKLVIPAGAGIPTTTKRQLDLDRATTKLEYLLSKIQTWPAHDGLHELDALSFSSDSDSGNDSDIEDDDIGSTSAAPAIGSDPDTKDKTEIFGTSQHSDMRPPRAKAMEALLCDLLVLRGRAFGAMRLPSTGSQAPDSPAVGNSFAPPTVAGIGWLGAREEHTAAAQRLAQACVSAVCAFRASTGLSPDQTILPAPLFVAPQSNKASSTAQSLIFSAYLRGPPCDSSAGLVVWSLIAEECLGRLRTAGIKVAHEHAKAHESAISKAVNERTTSCRRQWQELLRNRNSRAGTSNALRKAQFSVLQMQTDRSREFVKRLATLKRLAHACARGARDMFLKPPNGLTARVAASHAAGVPVAHAGRRFRLVCARAALTRSRSLWGQLAKLTAAEKKQAARRGAASRDLRHRQGSSRSRRDLALEGTEGLWDGISGGGPQRAAIRRRAMWFTGYLCAQLEMFFLMMFGEEPKHAGSGAELPQQVKADACHAAATRYAHHLARIALLEMDWRRASTAGAQTHHVAAAVAQGVPRSSIVVHHADCFSADASIPISTIVNPFAARHDANDSSSTIAQFEAEGKAAAAAVDDHDAPRTRKRAKTSGSTNDWAWLSNRAVTPHRRAFFAPSLPTASSVALPHFRRAAESAAAAVAAASDTGDSSNARPSKATAAVALEARFARLYMNTKADVSSDEGTDVHSSGSSLPETFDDPALGTPQRVWRRLKDLATRGLNSIIVDPERLGARFHADQEVGLTTATRSRRLILAHFAMLAEGEGRWGPFLLVAPAAELSAWHSAAGFVCPDLKVLPYWGGVETRARFRRFWTRRGSSLYSRNAPFHIVLTSLEVLAEDLQHTSSKEKDADCAPQTEMTSPNNEARIAFTKVLWQCAVIALDAPVCSAKDRALCGLDLLALQCLQCRHLILSLPSLELNLGDDVLLSSVLRFLVPNLFDRDQIDDWVHAKGKMSHIQQWCLRRIMSSCVIFPAATVHAVAPRELLATDSYVDLSNFHNTSMLATSRAIMLFGNGTLETPTMEGTSLRIDVGNPLHLCRMLCGHFQLDAAAMMGHSNVTGTEAWNLALHQGQRSMSALQNGKMHLTSASPTTGAQLKVCSPATGRHTAPSPVTLPATVTPSSGSENSVATLAADSNTGSAQSESFVVTHTGARTLLKDGQPQRCGVCLGCRAQDCRKCAYCLDMKKYGGPGTRKKPCIVRQCIALATMNPVTRSLQHGEAVLAQFKDAIQGERKRIFEGEAHPFEINVPEDKPKPKVVNSDEATDRGKRKAEKEAESGNHPASKLKTQQPDSECDGNEQQSAISCQTDSPDLAIDCNDTYVPAAVLRKVKEQRVAERAKQAITMRVTIQNRELKREWELAVWRIQTGWLAIYETAYRDDDINAQQSAKAGETQRKTQARSNAQIRRKLVRQNRQELLQVQEKCAQALKLQKQWHVREEQVFLSRVQHPSSAAVAASNAEAWPDAQRSGMAQCPPQTQPLSHVQSPQTEHEKRAQISEKREYLARLHATLVNQKTELQKMTQAIAANAVHGGTQELGRLEQQRSQAFETYSRLHARYSSLHSELSRLMPVSGAAQQLNSENLETSSSSATCRSIPFAQLRAFYDKNDPRISDAEITKIWNSFSPRALAFALMKKYGDDARELCTSIAGMQQNSLDCRPAAVTAAHQAQASVRPATPGQEMQEVDDYRIPQLDGADDDDGNADNQQQVSDPLPPHVQQPPPQQIHPYFGEGTLQQMQQMQLQQQTSNTIHQQSQQQMRKKARKEARKRARQRARQRTLQKMQQRIDAGLHAGQNGLSISDTASAFTQPNNVMNMLLQASMQHSGVGYSDYQLTHASNAFPANGPAVNADHEQLRQRHRMKESQLAIEAKKRIEELGQVHKAKLRQLEQTQSAAIDRSNTQQCLESSMPRHLPWAYAQLLGVTVPRFCPEGTKGLATVPFTAYMLRKSVILGRASRRWMEIFKRIGVVAPHDVGLRAGSIDIHLGNDPAIARRHAELFWDSTACAFFVRRLSRRHPISVDGTQVNYGDRERLEVKCGALLQMGHCCFTFLLPRTTEQHRQGQLTDANEQQRSLSNVRVGATDSLELQIGCTASESTVPAGAEDKAGKVPVSQAQSEPKVPELSPEELAMYDAAMRVRTQARKQSQAWAKERSQEQAQGLATNSSADADAAFVNTVAPVVPSAVGPIICGSRKTPSPPSTAK